MSRSEGLLSLRALNRATLERQLLLRRGTAPVLGTIAHLVGMQAQQPNAPYYGLWTRLDGFAQDALTSLLYDRSVVRSGVLRGTQHLVTAADFCWLRPLLRPAGERGRQPAFGGRLRGVDLAELAAAGRALLDKRTLTRPQLGRLLAERWPDHDPQVLAWSVETLVPVIHRPPSGTWGKGGPTPFTLAEEWLGRPLVTEPSPADLVLRYLAAFGPASVKDVQVWSGLSRLEEVVDRLRPRLRLFRDVEGRELFDVPGAPLPDPATPAPPRFLPWFDNLLVAHADRTRIMAGPVRGRVSSGGLVRPTILVDGFVRGTWTIERKPDAATLMIRPFEPLPPQDVSALTEEGARLLAFAAAGAGTHDIKFTVP